MINTDPQKLLSECWRTICRSLISFGSMKFLLPSPERSIVYTPYVRFVEACAEEKKALGVGVLSLRAAQRVEAGEVVVDLPLKGWEPGAGVGWAPPSASRGKKGKTAWEPLCPSALSGPTLSIHASISSEKAEPYIRVRII